MAVHSAPRPPRFSKPKQVIAGTIASLKALSRPQQAAFGGSVLLIVGLLVGLAAGGVFSGGVPVAAKAPAVTTTVPSTRCPLTDVPVAGGVPNRPPLAIKIGNEPGGSRPQSGLNEADIVFDTPAEGFIMRYVAVFQCNNATSIGPMRSVRWVDYHLLPQFSHPILAFAGGIDPNVNAVMALPWLEPANVLEGAQTAAHRISSRSAPDNLYTSTAALYGLFKTETTPPTSIFQFTPSLPAAAKPAASLAIDFSAGTDVEWKWNAKADAWLHYYSNEPDVDALTGQPVSTTNIVVEAVHYTFGPYPESLNGSGDFESQTVGVGSGYILRGGKSIAVTWHRPTPSSVTTYTDAKGQSVGLAPGRTWVELVPAPTFDSATQFALTP